MEVVVGMLVEVFVHVLMFVLMGTGLALGVHMVMGMGMRMTVGVGVLVAVGVRVRRFRLCPHRRLDRPVQALQGPRYPFPGGRHLGGHLLPAQMGGESLELREGGTFPLQPRPRLAQEDLEEQWRAVTMCIHATIIYRECSPR